MSTEPQSTLVYLVFSFSDGLIDVCAQLCALWQLCSRAAARAFEVRTGRRYSTGIMSS